MTFPFRDLWATKICLYKNEVFRIFGSRFLSDQSSVVDHVDQVVEQQESADRLDTRVLAYEHSNLNIEMKVTTVILRKMDKRRRYKSTEIDI